MNVEVKSFAHLRLALGQSPLRVQLPEGATVADLLTWLTKTYGDAAHDAIWTRDGSTLKVTPVSSGKVLSLQDPLADGMTITFMSNVAGGGR